MMVEQVVSKSRLPPKADVGGLGPPVCVDAAHRFTVIRNQLVLL